MNATVSDLVRGGRRSAIRSVVVAVLVAAAILVIHTMVDLDAQTDRVRSVVQAMGAIAPIAFVTLTALAIPLCIPVLVFIVTGSMAFGRLGGALYSLGGIVIGACVAFLLGRYVLHGLGARLQGSRVPVVRALASQRGPLPVIGIRFAMPFAPGLDYAIGAAGISLGDYLLGTVLGVIPRAFALSFFFGVLLRSDWMTAAISDPSLLFLLVLPLMRASGFMILVKLIRQNAAAPGVGSAPTA